MASDFTLHRPTSLEEAVKVYKKTKGCYMAAGTILLPDRLHGKELPRHVISLEAIPELHGITETEDETRIGAEVTFSELENSPLIKDRLFCLWEAASLVGGPQIRHRATIGGNVASAMPAADGATALLALQPTLELYGPEGSRLLPMIEFYQGFKQTALLPGEILVAFRISARDRASRFIKVGKRNAQAISCLNMAVVKAGSAYSLAVGSASPCPVYCKETSRILSEGPAVTAEVLERACAAVQTEISPIDDRWGTASYRRTVCHNELAALVRALEG